MRRERGAFPVALTACLGIAVGVGCGDTGSPEARPREAPITRERQPLAAVLHAKPPAVLFEANAGQTDPRVAYLARAGALQLFAFERGMRIAAYAPPEKSPPPGERPTLPSPRLRRTAADLTFVGAANRAPEGRRQATRTTRYYTRAFRHEDVASFGQIVYPDLYPGIDAVLSGRGRRIELSFVVKPGADPGAIRLQWRGAELAAVEDTRARVEGPLGSLHLSGLLAFQRSAGRRQPVTARFAEGPEDTLRFEVGAYDASRTLVIDPVLSFATLVGGETLDQLDDLVAGEPGHVYAAVQTWSSDFPGNVGTIDTGLAPRVGLVHYDLSDPSAPSATTLTVFGAQELVFRAGLARSPLSGEIFLAGNTDDDAIPTTAGVAFEEFNASQTAAYLARFAPDGSLLGATYLGSSFWEMSVDVDTSSGATQPVVAGTTPGPSIDPDTGAPVFLGTPGAFRETPAGNLDGFVTKLPEDLSSLVYYTYLGGTAGDELLGLRIADGRAYVTGETQSTDFPTTPGALEESFGSCPFSLCRRAFVSILDAAGDSVARSTYVSVGPGNRDAARAVDVDTGGRVAITGTLRTGDNAFQEDVFVALLEEDLGALAVPIVEFGELEVQDLGWDLMFDTTGDLHVVGYTSSDDLATPLAFQPARAGVADAFVARYAGADLQLAEFSYLGGTSSDFGRALALDADDTLYVGGTTYSPNFPVTANATQPEIETTGFDGDGFVARIDEPPPLLSVTKEAAACAAVGQPFEVRVRIQNDGGPTQVRVQDDLPGGATWTGALPTGCTLDSPQALRCDRSIGSSEALELLLTATPDLTGQLCNTAIAIGDDGGVVASNTVCTQVAEALGPPLLALQKTAFDEGGSPLADGASVAPGASVRFSVAIASLDGCDATGLRLTDTLDPALELAATSGPFACSTSLQSVTCPDLDVVGTQGLVLDTVVAADAAGEVCNRATLEGPDIAPRNAEACLTVDPDAGPRPRFGIEKSAEPEFVVDGGEVSWRIRISNTGDAPLEDVVAVDSPSGLFDFEEATIATCSEDGAEITCELLDIQPGGNVTFGLNGTVSGGPGLVCNIVSASASNQQGFNAVGCVDVRLDDGAACSATRECLPDLVCGTTVSLGELEASSAFCEIPLINLIPHLIGACPAEPHLYTLGPYCQADGPGVTRID